MILFSEANTYQLPRANSTSSSACILISGQGINWNTHSTPQPFLVVLDVQISSLCILDEVGHKVAYRSIIEVNKASTRHTGHFLAS